MTASVIKVENLSKCYRIGAKEEANRTFREVVVGAFGAPIKNLRRLRGLTKFDAMRHHGTGGATEVQDEDLIWALENVSFEVKEGEVLGIIGRNGAGKSTLLKILCRITEPTSGEAKLYGRVSSLLEVGTGFHPELTGRENIYLNGAVLGMRKIEIQQKFDEIVAFAEIDKFLDTPVKRYSSGMYVRLAFAVAAHLDPEILLVDEVLAVGDVAFQKKCLGKMGDEARKGRTVLLVSHNMGAIRNLSQRCILLKEGSMHLLADTPTVIGEYLKEGLFEEDAVRKFPENPQSPLYIKRVALLNEEGVPNRKFHLGSQIFVDIDYVVCKDIRQSMLILAVSRDGAFIFQSHDTDLTPELMNCRESGIYSTRVSIPRRLLTAGLYSLWVSAAVGSDGQYGHDGHPDALSFEIDEEDEDTSLKSYARKRGMLVIANLEWQTKKKG